MLQGAQIRQVGGKSPFVFFNSSSGFYFCLFINHILPRGLQLRTRTSLLHSLCEDLKDKTKDFLGLNGDGVTCADISKTTATSSSSSSEYGNGTISGAGSRFIDTVRKALIARVKTQTLSNAEANNNVSGGLSKKNSSCSADGSIPSVSKQN